MLLLMKFPDWKEKAFTMSYDDGVYQDIRLMEIMDKNGLKGTFNISTGLFSDKDVCGWGRMSETQTVRVYKDSGHEVAIHGYNHHFLDMLPDECAVSDVILDKYRLEELFGGVIRGMAYPMGTYNDDTVEILKRCGIAYARTVKSTEKFDIPDDWLRLPATCHHNSPKLVELADKFLNEAPRHQPWLFYLWGHSYEFDRDSNWDIIENFAEKVGGKDDIWYATNIEIYDYISAFRQLRFNLKMTYVENPTQTDVFFELDKVRYKEKYVVRAGEGIEL